MRQSEIGGKKSHVLLFSIVQSNRDIFCCYNVDSFLYLISSKYSSMKYWDKFIIASLNRVWLFGKKSKALKCCLHHWVVPGPTKDLLTSNVWLRDVFDLMTFLLRRYNFLIFWKEGSFRFYLTVFYWVNSQF